MSEPGVDVTPAGVRRRVEAAWRRPRRRPPRARPGWSPAGKLAVRARIAALVDDASFVEDGRLANALAEEPAPPTAWSPAAALVDGRLWSWSRTTRP